MNNKNKINKYYKEASNILIKAINHNAKNIPQIEQYRQTIYLYYDFLVIISALDVCKGSIRDYMDINQGRRSIKNILELIKKINYISSINFEQCVEDILNEHFRWDNLLKMNYNEMSSFIDCLYEQTYLIGQASENTKNMILLLFFYFKPKGMPAKNEYFEFKECTFRIFDEVEKCCANLTVIGMGRNCTSFYDLLEKYENMLKKI